MAHRLVEKYECRVPRYTSYPTALQFGPAVGAEHYRDWLSKVDRDRPISLYVHVPFCERLCWYCGCHTSVSRRDEPIAAYAAALEEVLR